MVGTIDFLDVVLFSSKTIFRNDKVLQKFLVKKFSIEYRM